MEHIETPLGWALQSVSPAHSVKEPESDAGLSGGEILLRDCVLIFLRVHHRSGNWRGPEEPAALLPWHCAQNQSGTFARDKLV